MNKQNQILADYVYLAEASYTDFSQPGDDYENLKDGENGEQPESFARLVSNNYEVVAYYKDHAWIGLNDESSFSGTLFKGRTGTDHAGKFVLALRGTQQIGSDLLSADAGDIVHDGLAHHQIVDMYNFWQQIKADKGQIYKVAKIVSVTEALTRELLEVFKENPNQNEWIGKGYFVDSGEIKRIIFEDSDQVYTDERATGLGIDVNNVIVTGHSLGGHLSAAFARLFPEATEHAYMINGAGFGSTLNPIGYIGSSIPVNIAQVFSALGGDSSFDAGKITNIIGDKALDVVANDWTIGLKQPGAQVGLFIETAGPEEIFGHGSAQMSDSMTVASLFFTMDNDLNNRDLQSALNILNPIFQAAHADDNQTLEYLVYKLGQLFLGTQAPALAKNRDELYGQIQNVLNNLLKSSGQYQVIPLANDTGWRKLAYQEDTSEGLAIRYALKELNPFAINGADYNLWNQNGELNLYSPDNPNGMTETYLQQRAAMLETLLWQNAVPPIITDAESPLNPNPYYADLTSKTYAQLGGNGASIGQRILFGTEQADTEQLTGGSYKDYLFGSGGADTLTGDGGDDYMEGGTGSDTYHIENHDTVFDSDMEGKVLFGDIQAASFKRHNGALNQIWFSEDKKLVAMIAANATDLFVMQQGTNNGVTIKDFFKIAKENGSGGLTGLGIELDVATKVSLQTERGAVGVNNRYNVFYANDAKYTSIKGGNLDDLVFSSSAGMQAIMGEGNDRVFGSLSADTIKGELGNDILNGSIFIPAGTTKPKEELDKDADIIIGGAGRDLINGMAGDDIIHTGEEGEHLFATASNERGDWALGHLGNDYIYGSKGQDFLQGGEGSDMIHGGADDDVILGDGFIRFGNKGFNLSGTPPSVSIEYVPSPGYGNFNPNIVNIPGNALGVEHTLKATDKDNDHAMTPLYSVSVTDKTNDNWSVGIDRDKGDYTLSTAVPLINNQHRVAKDGAGDYLYGGNGNDLIIGQDGNDFLWGGDDDDILWGDDNRDAEIAGHDYLFGDKGNDTLYGGKGDDTLYGGSGHNILNGGEGNDTYILQAEEFDGLTHNTITDSDGLGRILVGDAELGSYTWHFDAETQKWQTDQSNIRLKQDGNNLLIMNEYAIVSATVQHFESGQLGIRLIQNQAPVATNPPQPLKTSEGSPLQYSFSQDLFQDEDTASLTYTLTTADGQALPDWLHFDAATRSLSGTPGFEAAGNYTLKLTATDKEGLEGSTLWQLTISNSNRAPQATGHLAEQQLTAGQSWQHTLALAQLFRDADAEDQHTLGYRISMADGSPLPQWLRYDETTHTLSGSAPEAGQLALRISATDSSGATAEQTLRLLIAQAEEAKELRGSWGDDTLTGGAADDKLIGLVGNDTLNGRAGNDRLEGGLGNDTYLYRRGDGNDRIYDSYGQDNLKLGAGIHKEDLWFSRTGRDLSIRLLGSDESITVEGWYNLIPRQIESISTQDGGQFGVQAVQQMVQAMAAFAPQAGSGIAVEDQMRDYARQLMAVMPG